MGGFDRRGSLPSTARRLFEIVGGNGGGPGSGYGDIGAATGERSEVDEPLSGDSGSSVGADGDGERPPGCCGCVVPAVVGACDRVAAGGRSRRSSILRFRQVVRVRQRIGLLVLWLTRVGVALGYSDRRITTADTGNSTGVTAPAHNRTAGTNPTRMPAAGGDRSGTNRRVASPAQPCCHPSTQPNRRYQPHTNASCRRTPR